MTEITDLTSRRIARFYLPLLLNVQLMSVSHTIINGALSRQNDPVTDLAAFGVAVALHLFIASIAFQNHTVVLARGKTRQGFLQVSLYGALLATIVTLVLGLFGYTAVGDWVLFTILGVEGKIASEAKAALRIMTFLPFFTGVRGLAQGHLIRAGRTELVSLSTLIRIGALSLSLIVGASWFQGASLGAFALWGCIAVETGFACWFACRCHPGWDVSTPKSSFSEICRFGFPLAASSGLQLTLPLLVSAIISRLPDGELGLAGFGIIRGFLFLLAGPQRNLQQAYLALVQTTQDQRTLWRFNLGAGLCLASIMLLLAFPLNGLVFGYWMETPIHLRQAMILPMVVASLFPLGVGIVYQLAGHFTLVGQTGLLGKVVLLKMLYLGLWWGGLHLMGWPALPLSSVLLAILLFLSAQWIELACLAFRGRKLPRPSLIVPNV